MASGEFDQALARLRADVNALLVADVSGLQEASLRSEQLPDCGGTPVTVLATTTMSELAAAAEAEVAAGSRPPVQTGPPPDLGRLALDAGLELGDLLASSSSGLALLSHGQVISARSLLAWACEAAAIRDGVVWWTPPAWEDPDQRRRRNTVHHLAKIEFGRPEAA